jgi:F-type H+-transporting ATPase subunit delta
VKGEDAVAHVYAEALLELAFSKGTPGEVLADLQEIGKVLAAQPRSLAFLISPNIRMDAKRQVIDKAFGGRVAEVVQNFLKVVVEKGRAAQLPRIIASFIAAYHERQGELVVKVSSAQPLDEDERDRVKNALKKRHKAAGYTDVILEERVDAALIGGLVVRTGDNVYDASLRTRLHAIGDKMKTSRLRNEETYEN